MDQVVEFMNEQDTRVRVGILQLPYIVPSLSEDQIGAFKRAVQDCLTDLSSGENRQIWEDIAQQDARGF